MPLGKLGWELRTIAILNQPIQKQKLPWKSVTWAKVGLLIQTIPTEDISTPQLVESVSVERSQRGTKPTATGFTFFQVSFLI